LESSYNKVMKINKGIPVKKLLSNVNYTNCIIGNEYSIVYGFSDDFFVKNGDLTWTDNRVILNKLLSMDCQLTIITNLRVDKYPMNNAIINCNNPLKLFEKIIDSIFTWPNKDAIIGEKTQIHDTVIIGQNVKIGDNCFIAPYVVIGDNVTIGNNVKIGSFSTLGNTPYYIMWDSNHRLRTRNIYGCVKVGNNVHIGSYCSIDNGITTDTEISSGCKLGNYVEISHDVKVGKNCCLCTQTAVSGFVKIGNDCVFWGRSGVSNRIIIAPRTTILASSVVTKSIIIEGQTLCGYPAIEKTKYWKSLSKLRNM